MIKKKKNLFFKSVLAKTLTKQFWTEECHLDVTVRQTTDKRILWSTVLLKTKSTHISTTLQSFFWAPQHPLNLMWGCFPRHTKTNKNKEKNHLNQKLQYRFWTKLEWSIVTFTASQPKWKHAYSLSLPPSFYCFQFSLMTPYKHK